MPGRRILALPNGIPSHDTFGRVFRLLDPDELRVDSLLQDIRRRRDEADTIVARARAEEQQTIALRNAAERELVEAERIRQQTPDSFYASLADFADALLADLPGYGYAAVERAAKLRWQEVMADYLRTRRNLHGVVQMIDSRLGFTDLDRQLLALIAPRVASGEVRLLVLLTKADKLNRREADAALRAAQAVLGELAGEHSDIGLTLFSALSRHGVADAALALREWVAGMPPAPEAHADTPH